MRECQTHSKCERHCDGSSHLQLFKNIVTDDQTLQLRNILTSHQPHMKSIVNRDGCVKPSHRDGGLKSRVAEAETCVHPPIHLVGPTVGYLVTKSSRRLHSVCTPRAESVRIQPSWPIAVEVRESGVRHWGWSGLHVRFCKLFARILFGWRLGSPKSCELDTFANILQLVVSRRVDGVLFSSVSVVITDD